MMMTAMLILMKLNRQWRIWIIQIMITGIELLIALQMNVSVGIGIVDDSRRWIIDEIIGMKKKTRGTLPNHDHSRSTNLHAEHFRYRVMEQHDDRVVQIGREAPNKLASEEEDGTEEGIRLDDDDRVGNNDTHLVGLTT